MPFPFCGKRNKEDKKDPPYSKKSTIEENIESHTALLDEEKNKVKLARDESMRLKSDLNNVQKQLADANAKLAEKSKSVEEVSNNKLRELEEEIREYKRKFEDAEKAKEAINTDKVELEKKLKRAEDATDGIALSVQKEITKEATSKLETDLSNLQNVKEKIEEERDRAQKRLKDAEESHKTAVVQLESQLSKLQREKEDTEEKLKASKREKDAAENTLAHTKKELDIAKKESHIPRSPTGHPSEEWMNKLKSAEAEKKKEREERMEREKDVSRLLNERDQMKKDNEDILQQMQQLQSSAENTTKNKENAERSHRTEIDRIRADFKKTIAEKDAENDALLTRLSAATAAQVLDGNPNVSDLSDPNRPQKLGEQMCTLYDDEWTDASEELEKLDKFKDDEVAIVTTLFELIKSVYNHCKEASDNQLSRIEEDIFLPPMENPPPSSPDTNGTDQIPVKSPTKHSASKIPRYASLSGRTGSKDSNPGKDKEKKQRCNTGSKGKGDKMPEVPVEVRKGIKDYRKQVAKQVIDVIEKEVLQKFRNNPDFGDGVVDACKPYIKRCVEICWNMCVQDPPVVLKWDVSPDYTFDADRYRAYTKNGRLVDYVVWPIIYLYEGGSILMKGVAQGKNS